VALASVAVQPDLINKLCEIVASLSRHIDELETLEMWETASLMRIVRLDLQVKLGVVSEGDLETLTFAG
jgi:hypothetical protein